MSINNPHSTIKFSGKESINVSLSIRQRSITQDPDKDHELEANEYELEVGGEGYKIPSSVITYLEENSHYHNVSEQDKVRIVLDKLLRFSSEQK
jgi:hypothetical protein